MLYKMRYLFVFILVYFAIFLHFSCIKYIEVEKTKIDTVKVFVKDTIVLTKTDTLVIRDSIKITKIDTLVIRDTIRYSDNLFPALNIVADGNSLTVGYNNASGVGDSYPNQLIRQTPFAQNGSNLVNFAVGGQTISQMLQDSESQIDNKINIYKKNICLVWEGRNELIINYTSPTACFEKLKKYCQDRKKVGFEVYLLTITPSYNYNNGLSDYEANQRISEVNRLIINDKSRIFKVVRLDLIAELQTITETYYGDKIHFTNAGYTLIMQKVKEEILKL